MYETVYETDSCSIGERCMNFTKQTLTLSTAYTRWTALAYLPEQHPIHLPFPECIRVEPKSYEKVAQKE